MATRKIERIPDVDISDDLSSIVANRSNSSNSCGRIKHKQRITSLFLFPPASPVSEILKNDIEKDGAHKDGG